MHLLLRNNCENEIRKFEIGTIDKPNRELTDNS